MSETKHTPGPWTIAHARNGTGDIGIKAPGVPNIIAECYAAMRHHDERSTETLANARLIAAAPDLLEALINLRAKFYSACIHTGTAPEFAEVACAQFDAAIKRATEA